MQRTNPDIDIVLDVLNAVLKEKPDSVFVSSLHRQYCERGGLSRKQLEGLHSKASKIPGMHPGKMATLEAIIKKKPTKYKSEAPKEIVNAVKDKNVGQMIQFILSKYPEHKRVLFLRAKYENDEVLSALEISDLDRFFVFAGKGGVGS